MPEHGEPCGRGYGEGKYHDYCTMHVWCADCEGWVYWSDFRPYSECRT